MEQDHFFMKHCIGLAQAAKAQGKTAVGSVVVRNGEIVAEGREGEPGYPELLAHAEVVALLKATETFGTSDLSGCIVYTTVEPCLMCSFLIRELKIAAVVFGVEAGQIGGTNPGLPVLTTGSLDRWKVTVKVRSGVMADECRAVLRK